MKKSIVFIVVLVLCLALAACGAKSGSPGGEQLDMVVITEKLFIQQCNDIYLNPSLYEQKRVRIEGICDIWQNEEGEICYSVYRNGPGCCGNDGVAGFQFKPEGKPAVRINDWIAVEGVPRSVQLDDYGDTVVIGNAVVTVKTERGAEYVEN
ncbi:MAG: hypothetical protein LBB50_00810 [Oscillospiraceae bacterium]|jgi:uncharacterized membrane protein YcgQ (UPF0703/DUF1980 family)|nr:hypothetical protein [Oscillospiraceae bacterium]